MGYIDPRVSDRDFIAGDPRLRREQAREDHREAMAEGGMDAAVIASRQRAPVPRGDGFQKIPGASRSGAIEPQVRTRMERQEKEGLIELQRNGSGHLIGWRPVDGQAG